MTFSSLLRYLTQVCERNQTGRLRRQKSHGQRRPFIPRLDCLEDRVTPSTLLVTNNSDTGVSGDGSLRGEIAAASKGDRIVFAPFVHAITLTRGELVINKDLDIEGPGANSLTISGGDSSRVFHITGGVVTVAGLTVAHGQATGLLDQLSSNSHQAGGGGGILNEAGASLTLSQDVLTDNQAIATPGNTVVGGGLLNLGTANVQSCLFSNNQTVGGSGSDNLGGSCGGGIDNFGGANLTVSDSTFSNNRAVAAGGDYYYGIGGAVENNAGLSSYDPQLARGSTATFTNCNFLDNVATGGSGAVGNGGALDNEGIGTTVTLSGCRLDGNRSLGGDGSMMGGSQGIGGALMNGFGTLNVDNCTITNNLALGGDNGLISGTTQSPYQFASGAFGGGIENNLQGVLNISNSTISGNTAQGGAMTSLPGPGGIGVGGGISNSPSATMTMTNCVVSSNSALGGNGNAGVNTNLVTGQQAGFGFGGGIDISSNSSATILSSLITANQAVGGEGGSGNNGGNGDGGGIGVGSGVLVGSSDASSLTLRNSVVSDNQAVGGKGGNGNTSSNGSSGGGVFAGGATLTIQNSTISGNRAFASGGNNGNGGGVAVNTTGTGAAGSTLTNVTISGNTSDNAGAGIDKFATAGTLTLLNDTVAFNSANSGPGGVNVVSGSGTVTVENTIVARNRSNGTGPDVNGAFTSAGGNFLGDGTNGTGFTAANDRVGTTAAPLDPLLAPLADNGGTATLPDGTHPATHALLPGSPALNTANTVDAPATDERGFPRVGQADIGAFEFQNADLALSLAGSPTTGVVGQPLTYLLSITNLGPNTSRGATLTDFLPAGVLFLPDRSSPVVTASGNQITLAVPDLAAGGRATLVVTVLPATSGSLSNLAVLNSADDPNPANNAAGALSQIQPAATLPAGVVGDVSGLVQVIPLRIRHGRVLLLLVNRSNVAIRGPLGLVIFNGLSQRLLGGNGFTTRFRDRRGRPLPFVLVNVGADNLFSPAEAVVMSLRFATSSRLNLALRLLAGDLR